MSPRLGTVPGTVVSGRRGGATTYGAVSVSRSDAGASGSRNERYDGRRTSAFGSGRGNGRFRALLGTVLGTVVLASLAGCARREGPVEPAPDTTIAVTAPAFSVWYLRLDTTRLQIYGFHLASGLYADTVHIPVPDTLPHPVYGNRLDPGSGWPLCRDWHEARRGEVVTLWCEPQ